MLRGISAKFSFLVLVTVLSVFPASAQQLDPTFGSGGVSLTAYPYPNPAPFSYSISMGTEGFLRPDGGITILGTHTITQAKTGPTSRMRLVTFTSTGTNPQIGDSPNSLLSTDAAQQPDGKIIAVGSTSASQTVPGDWFVERLNLSGQLDPTFGSGVVILDFGTPNERATNVAVQNDGKILVSGSISGPGGSLTVVARLNPDGTADPTFGPDGSGFLYLFDNALLSQKMLLKPDGKILLLGTYYENPPQPYETVSMFYQLNSNGSPDLTFGESGVAYTIDSGQLIPKDLKARQNGDIFVLSTREYRLSGTFYYDEQDIVLTKLGSTGSIDTTFGNSGRVISNDSPPYPRMINTHEIIGYEAAGALLIDSTGNILVAGIATMAAPNRSAYSTLGVFQGQLRRNTVLLIKRYNGAGQLIGKNFDGQTLRTEYVGGEPAINGMFEQPGNRVVVFGGVTLYTYDTSNPPNTAFRGHIMLTRFSAISSVNNANNFYDYNLNGTADFVTYAPIPGNFSKWNVTRFELYPWGTEFSPVTRDFGLEYDTPVPGDYDGDGVQDLAVFRDDAGDWFTRKIFLDNCGPMNCTAQVHFGQPGDIPATGDFDGDGTSDRAVFRPSEGNWYILFANGSWTGLHFGQNGDLPVTGDYDDDGRSDVAVIRRENGFMTWYVLQSSNNQFIGIQFGLDTDKAVPADYTGDGRTEIAVWRPSEGNWYTLSNYTGFSSAHWGLAGDIPEPADYDGDGKADFAVYRPSEGNHYALASHNQALFTYHAGQAGDIPVPSAYVR